MKNNKPPASLIFPHGKLYESLQYWGHMSKTGDFKCPPTNTTPHLTSYWEKRIFAHETVRPHCRATPSTNINPIPHLSQAPKLTQKPHLKDSINPRLDFLQRNLPTPTPIKHPNTERFLTLNVSYPLPPNNPANLTKHRLNYNLLKPYPNTPTVAYKE